MKQTNKLGRAERKDSSTTSWIYGRVHHSRKYLYIYRLLQTDLQRHTKLYVVFVDFQAAFDTVNRNVLRAVSRLSDLNGKLYRAFKDIYTSMLACVCDK